MEYIKTIRKFVGHTPIMVCTYSCLIFNGKSEVLLQKSTDNGLWKNPNAISLRSYTKNNFINMIKFLGGVI